MAQEQRLMAVHSPLGEDLRLVSFSGREEMSRLFFYSLEMVSPKDTIPPEKIVGKEASIRIFLADGSTERYFSGIISRFSADFAEGGGTLYRAEMVPSFWLLTQTSDCRIFQDMTVPDIIEKVFNESVLKGSWKKDLRANYRKIEYCVQFRETDFNFVSRLMEQEGIFYYFKHEEEKHTLILADHIGAYKNIPENRVNFPPSHLQSSVVEDHITDWRHDYEFISGKWAQTDYNFKKPSTSLMAQETASVPVKETKNYEVYDYPGEYVEPSDGKQLTRIRMEEEEVSFDQASGASTCRTFTVGGKFQFDQYIPPGENGKTYVITAIEHRGVEPGAYSTGTGLLGGCEYSNTFTCIAADVPFRPARITPKPLVSGIQSAVVVGKKGEEIYCDEYGRVKVQFHWDREGKRDEKSSCWIRVAHHVAGRKWGFMAIPRIGQEVIVDFLNGDPDQPLIIGSVYNQEQMPHYTLPDDKAKTYIKTNSTKGGDGFNELFFDDVKDSERVFIHAQKDMDVRVRNDSRERIYGNRHQIIGWEKDGKKGGDQQEMIWQDKHLNIKRHQIEHIEGNYTIMVGAGEAEDGGNLAGVIEKNIAIKIGKDGLSTINEGDTKQEVQGSQSLTVQKDLKQQVGTFSLTCGGDCNEKTKNLSVESEMESHHKAGMKYAVEGGQEVHIKAGMNCVVEAGMSLTLKGPGGFINISPAGVAIQGNLVLINSGGAAGAGTGCQLKPPKVPDTPNMAEKAQPKTPAQAHREKTGFKSAPG